MNSPRLLIPSNILLFGEYAVLEAGGLALSMASKPYVSAWAEPADVLGCTAIMDTRTYSSIADNKFLAALSAAFFQEGIVLTPLNITVDSSAFFADATQLKEGGAGKKLGLGSSAAATVAMAALLLDAAGIDPLQHGALLERLAVRAHRAVKGGSAYDVLTSMNGKYNLIIGGKQPYAYTFEALPYTPISMIHTPSVCDSTQAVRAYEAWKKKAPNQQRAFLQASNAIILSLMQGNRLQSCWQEARSMSFELSQRIGIPMNETENWTEELQDALAGSNWKFSGAGDELIVLFDAIPKEAPDVSISIPLTLAEGMHWERG